MSNDSNSPISLTLPEGIEANGTSWLSGMAVTKAVDVIRSWNRPNIFIGNGDSNTTINSWDPTQQLRTRNEQKTWRYVSHSNLLWGRARRPLASCGS